MIEDEKESSCGSANEEEPRKGHSMMWSGLADSFLRSFLSGPCVCVDGCGSFLWSSSWDGFSFPIGKI